MFKKKFVVAGLIASLMVLNVTPCFAGVVEDSKASTLKDVEAYYQENADMLSSQLGDFIYLED